jgi:uncharacterized protein YcaQ
LAEPIATSARAIRRLAVTRQHLAGKTPTRATRDGIVSLIRDLAYIQWDPVTTVAPSHIISIWSRLGKFRVEDLDALMWKEKRVFEHWTPIASLVLTEDYPLFLSLMKRYPGSLTGSWRSHEIRAKKFLADHGGLRKRMLADLGKGPLLLGQFRDYVRGQRSPDGWTPGSDVTRMLFHLSMLGEVMVVGHEGNQNVWGLSEDFLPAWAVKEELPEEEFERQAAQRAIRALGTAAPREINFYFPRGRYRSLERTLSQLEKESLIHRVVAEGIDKKYERYVHDKDVSLLEELDSGDFEPRLALIAPFDNLIAGRERTNRIFGFDYVHEQFLPKGKRKFGTMVLPILWGDELIGRIDPQMDRKSGNLRVNSVHAQPGAPQGREVASKISDTVNNLAEFLGAKGIEYSSRVPEAWRNNLR